MLTLFLSLVRSWFLVQKIILLRTTKTLTVHASELQLPCRLVERSLSVFKEGRAFGTPGCNVKLDSRRLRLQTLETQVSLDARGWEITMVKYLSGTKQHMELTFNIMHNTQDKSKFYLHTAKGWGGRWKENLWNCLGDTNEVGDVVIAEEVVIMAA